MAGVLTKQGTFTTPSSGTTTVSGLGFQPSAILFWVSGPNGVTNDTWATTTGIENSIGFAAFDGTNYYNACNGYMAETKTANWREKTTISRFLMPEKSIPRSTS